MSSKKLLLVGSNGYVGSNLATYFSSTHKITTVNSTDDLVATLKADSYDLVINAAVTVDKSPRQLIEQSHPSFLINVRLVQDIVQNIGERTQFVQLSTRDVYGSGFRANQVNHLLQPIETFSELARIAPDTIYGHTKAQGEEIALKHPRGIVVRYSTPYSHLPHKRGSLVQHFCKLAKEDGVATLAGGMQKRDIIHIFDIASLITTLTSRNCSGIFNAAGSDVLSIAELAILCGVTKFNVAAQGDLGCVLNGYKARLNTWYPKMDLIKSLKTLKEAL